MTITRGLEIKYKYLLKYYGKIINKHIQILFTTTNFDNNEEKGKKEESRDNYV